MKNLIVIVSIILCAIGLKAQEKDCCLSIQTTVFSKTQERSPVKNIRYQVTQDENPAEVFHGDESGKVTYQMNYDHKYVFEFGDPDDSFLPKLITFNTFNVPESDRVGGDFRFRFDITLFEKDQISEGQKEVFKKPIAEIIYNPEKKDFDYNKEYVKKVQKELENAK